MGVGVVHVHLYSPKGLYLLASAGLLGATFLNEEAERVLGLGQELVGRLLWDLTALRVPGLRALCEETVARSKPTGLDFLAPGNRRWCHLRLVPLQTVWPSSSPTSTKS